MSKIVIGKSGSHNVAIDLHLLLTTRLLVTSDSGGGKTWLLKRICEQASGKVQIIIVDPEGEFAPLREKLPFVLAGKAGETPTDPRTAEKLALTLLQARANAVCDLYEMKASDRGAWVRIFIDALLGAPKNLRHPCVVIVDEAHMFCPENGKGESEATDAMKGLCTRGRKRLLCAVFATQRLATLAKDASSMLLNRLIGPTFEDVNRKRAAEVLGVSDTKGERADFYKEIQLLEPGNFFALGRAISRERLLVHVGGIETPHGEEARRYEIEPPPPPDKIRALLPKLSDLPRAAEEEAKTVADFKKQIRELKGELRQKSVAPVGNTAAVNAKTDTRAIEKAVREVSAALVSQANQAIAERDSYIRETLRTLKNTLDTMIRVVLPKPRFEALKITNVRVKENSVPAKLPAVAAREAITAPRAHQHAETNGNSELTPYQRDILRGLAELEAIGRSEVPRGLAGAASGKSHKSSTFEKYSASLRAAGMIEYRGSKLALTEEGRSKIGAVDQSLTSEELQERLMRILTPYQREIVKALVDAGGEVLAWDEIGERIGKSAASSTFEKYMASLRSAEIIEYAGPKKAKVADWLFLE